MIAHLLNDDGGERPDVVAGDLAAAARPFTDGAPIVFGGAGARPVEPPGDAVGARVVEAEEAAAFDRAGDEVLPQFEGAGFVQPIAETKADLEAEWGCVREGNAFHLSSFRT